MASILGSYEIIKDVGHGGMGKVFAARHIHTQEIVAIKVVPHDISEDIDTLERFAREGRILRQLDHPNIVKLVDIIGEGHRSALVMEFVGGGSLQKYIKEMGPLDIDDFLRIAIPITDALAHAHSLGILHRDVKPANVLMSKDDNPRLTDFGLSRTESSEDSMTGSGMIVGSHDYLSPEAIGEAPVSPSMDIWALGITFYEMLTASRPFTGRTQLETLMLIMSEDLPPITERRDNLPPELIVLINEMLEKDPDERIQSMDAVRERLKTF